MHLAAGVHGAEERGDVEDVRDEAVGEERGAAGAAMVLLSILPALAHHSLNPAGPDEDEAGAGAVDEGATVVPLLPPSSGSP